MAVITRKEQFLRFFYRFFLIFAAFVFAAVMMPKGFNSWYNSVWAGIVGAILSVTDGSVRVAGELVSYNGFRVVVIPECTGLIAMLLFTAFILAFPASARGRLQGLMYGLPILFAFNAFRLSLLLVIGENWPSAFEYVHIYIAQMLFILVVFIICLTWLRRHSDTGRGVQPGYFPLKAVGVASLFFMVWMFTNEWYVAGTEIAARILAGRLEGYDGAYRYGPFFDPKTFNVVTFATLVVLTSSVPWKKRGRFLLMGIAVLAANSVAQKMVEMHNAQYHTFWGIRLAIFLNFLGQLFLPPALWFWMAHPHVFKKQGVTACPICGAEKAGLRDHIIAKHGLAALDDDTVGDALGRQSQES
jgi:exosortase/archaeosortase family protein